MGRLDGALGLCGDGALGREIVRTADAFVDGTQLATTTFYDSRSGKAGFVSRPFTFSPSVGPPSSPPGVGWTFTYDEVGRLTSAQPSGEMGRTLTYEGLKATEFLGGVAKSYRVDDGGGRVTLTADFAPTASDSAHEFARPTSTVRSGCCVGSTSPGAPRRWSRTITLVAGRRSTIRTGGRASATTTVSARSFATSARESRTSSAIVTPSVASPRSSRGRRRRPISGTPRSMESGRWISK